MDKVFLHKMLRLSVVVLILFSLVLVGCSKEEDDEDQNYGDPIELTREGWSEFEDLNWEHALILFEDAIAADGGFADAYSGAGWSLYKLGDNADAISMWTNGLDGTGDISSIKVGLGFANYDQDNYSAAITYLDEVVTASPNYRFEHISWLDYSYIHWKLGKCYYLNGQFAESLEEIQMYLNPNFDADIDTAAGRLELAAELERLHG